MYGGRPRRTGGEQDAAVVLCPAGDALGRCTIVAVPTREEIFWVLRFASRPWTHRLETLHAVIHVAS